VIVLEQFNEASAAPKLDIVPVNDLSGPFEGFCVVVAYDLFEVEKVSVAADEIGSVIRHGAAPLDKAGAQNSQSPKMAMGGAVMSRPCAESAVKKSAQVHTTANY
jgi:hypothetical protein